MSLCRHSDNNHIFDITPVENLFIHEFMLKAPGDFVKVYLFGLMQCYNQDCSENTIQAFSDALGLETSVVENAFRYWERQGVLSVSKDEDGQLSVVYHNLKDLVYNKGLNSEKTLYKYRDFNQSLQQIFDKRLLSPQEYLRIYDWIEVLNLPKEVVLMMVRFCVSRKNSKISINYLDKVAEGWAREGINTLQKAEEYIRAQESCYKNTQAVLKYFGMSRTPTQAELDMYKKWQDEWGFSLDSVLAAARETTKVQSPTFAYLDKILGSLYEKGIISANDIKMHLESSSDMADKIKEIYRQLGYKNTSPAPEHIQMYNAWIKECKLEHGVILLACKQCIRKRMTSFESLDNLLRQWASNGLVTEESIKAWLSRKKYIENEIKAVLERAGEVRDITLADRKLYKQWTEEWNMSFELILLAAEYALTAREKMPFINKILSSWHQNNIRTIKEAKADRIAHLQKLPEAAGQNQTIKKQLDFTKFPQHAYSDEELEQLFENIDDL